MMVAAEVAVVLEECVVVEVVVTVLAALVPLAALVLEVAWDSIRSSFIARLASSVSVTVLVAVVGDSVPPVPDAPDGGEVGEIVEVGDLSGTGISRSIEF